jgi:hypothetical protein
MPPPTPRPSSKERFLQSVEKITHEPSATDFESAYSLVANSLHVTEDFYFSSQFCDLDPQKPDRRMSIAKEVRYEFDQPDKHLYVVSGYKVMLGRFGQIKIQHINADEPILDKPGND